MACNLHIEILYNDNSNYIQKMLKLLTFNIQLIENYNNINEISCGYNRLTSLPELPQILIFLYCSHNKLTYLLELQFVELD